MPPTKNGSAYRLGGDANTKIHVNTGITKLSALKIKAQLAVILVLVGVYSLQVATPLRLHPDTVILLSLAETVEHGGGYLYHGQSTVFPPGYPTVLAGLMKVNMARSSMIVGLNVLFLAIGLLGVRSILRAERFSESAVLSVCILSLFSLVFIKYSAIPLTDPLFFGLSACCLALMKAAVSCFTLRKAVLSIVLVMACICVRRIGIALIPALLWMLLSQPTIRLYAKRPVSIILGGLVAIALASVVRVTSTLQDFTMNVHDSLLCHFKELGEIALNGTLGTTEIARVIIGIMVLLSVLGGIVWRRNISVIDVYLVAYIAIVLVWPWYDIRFWLPVVPLLFAYCGGTLITLCQSRELTSYLGAIYVVLFSAIGIVMLVANTRLSFAGSDFANAYPDLRYHSAYCAVWQCKYPGTDTVNADALHLLQYYK